jgi:hypothetical protein
LLALVAAVWQQPSPGQRTEGWATFYAEGVMEAVAANRGYIAAGAEYGAWLAREGLLGAVALNAAGDLGRVVWIDGPRGMEGPYLVIDCAQARHYAERELAGRVVEVDWPTSRRWGMEGPVSVTVWFEPPRRGGGKVPM